MRDFLTFRRASKICDSARWPDFFFGGEAEDARRLPYASAGGQTKTMSSVAARARVRIRVSWWIRIS
jgi:hypothetical protein